ncbi:MAG TPA: protein kinase [Gemmataceae bacterium]|jgi:serine/threonine protein kinase/WD40 repeat protein
MNADELPTARDERYADVLEACHDRLAQGESLERAAGPDVPAEFRPRLQHALDCLQRLERLWPRQPEPLTCPLCGHVAPPPRASFSITRPMPGHSAEGDPGSSDGAGAGTAAGRSLRRGVWVPGYEILEEVGRGGMGVVYKARQIALNRLVALKMIPAGQHAGPQELARFRTEAEVVAQLQHPNIVQIYDVGLHEGCPYFSMEFIEGHTLDQHCAGRPQPPDRSAGLVETLARVVHYAHQRGIVHRDLKPSNILLTADGAPRIGDFGLAKRLEDDSGPTRSGVILGTPEYMAPEQAAGRSKIIGPAADIYALGAILYTLLVGRPPFRGETALDTVRYVQNEDAVPIRSLQPGVPRDLEVICLKCLHKEPRKRYPTAEVLAGDLERFGRGEAIQARPIHTVERLGRWCRRNPWRAALFASVPFLLLVLAVGASLTAWQLRQERNAAIASEQTAEEARRAATDALWDSSLAQASVGRLSGQPGQRVRGLEALARAAAIRPSVELRNEAIACLALMDLSPARQLQRPTDTPFGWAFDASLRHYAYSDERGAITIHRLEDNQVVLRLPAHGQPAWMLRFSPDGARLAARHHPRHGLSGEILLWDIGDPDAVRREPRSVPGLVEDFHPDGRRVAIALRDTAIGIHDAATGKRLEQFTTEHPVLTLAYDPTGKRLAVSFEGAPVQIRDSSSGTVIHNLAHRQPVRALAWGAGGELLATACNDRRIYVWNTLTGKLRATLTGQEGATRHLTFNRAGDLLAGVGWDDTLRLWEPLTGRELLRTAVCADPPQFSEDDRYLACCSSRSTIDLWEIHPGRICRWLIGAQQTRQPTFDMDFNASGALLASASLDGLHLWDVASAAEIDFAPHNSPFTVCFAPDGRSLFSCSYPGRYCWPIQSGTGKRPRFGPGRPLAPQVREAARMAAFSRDGQVCAVVRRDQTVHILHAGPPAREVVVRHAELNNIAISPDGRWVAAGTFDGQGVKIWDAATGKQEHALPIGQARVAFSPDGRWLVTAAEREYRSWQVGTWQIGPLHVPRDRAARADPLTFCDGKLLAVAPSLRQIRLVEADTGRELAALTAPHPEWVMGLCGSPDGRWLAVAYRNNLLQLWDLQQLRAGLAEMGLDWSDP